MNQKTISMILSFVMVILTIMGAILLAMSIFTDNGTNYLTPALICIIVGNLLNLVRMQMIKKK